MYLSILIPAYNEAGRIVRSLEKIFHYLATTPVSYEIIVVNDGSIDETAAVIAEHFPGCPYLRVYSYSPNHGKGYAVKYGFLQAHGQYVLISDADLSTPIEEVVTLFSTLRKGYDICIGSRALPQSQVIVSQPLLRKCAGKLFNKLLWVLMGMTRYRDTQCGFKLFDRSTTLPIFERLRTERFSFDVEVLYLAHKYGLRVAEVPIQWYNSFDTKVHFLRDSIRMCTDLLRIRWYDWRRYYEL